MDVKYTIEEIAKRLKVSKKTILREVKRGRLKTEKVGRRHLVSERSLEIYLQGGDKFNLQQNLAQFLNKNKAEMITLLQKMVTMASDTNVLNQEARLALFIKNFLEEKGIRGVLYKDNEAVAVRGTFGFADEGLLLDCPLDTTPPGDLEKWTYPPFDGVIKKGKMYGRGTADAKAGIITMIYAVLALKEYVDEERLRVELVFDGGEQSGNYLGMKEVLKRGLPVSAGIVGYAGDWKDIAIGARGYHRYIMTTHGKSSHTGSRYSVGINAINKMAKFISHFEKYPLISAKSKYFDFGTRVSFSQIEGGHAINIVPDECVAKVDIRTTPNLKRKEVEEYINSQIVKLKKTDPDFDLSVNYLVGQEGYILKENEKVISELSNSIQNTIRRKLPFIATGPAHIGNLLYDYGIPVVLWGPKGDNVHSYDEYVEIESLTQTVEIYIKTIMNYFSLQESDLKPRIGHSDGEGWRT